MTRTELLMFGLTFLLMTLQTAYHWITNFHIEEQAKRIREPLKD